MKVLAIITARKNSQRIKRKNRLKIDGENLVARTHNFAKKIKFIKKTILTTNDIFFINKKKDSSLVIIKRPEKLSRKNSSSVNAILHATKFFEKNFFKFEAVLLLQPTSPFRSMKSINQGYKLFKKFNGKYSVISVSKTQDPRKRNFNISKNRLTYDKNIKNEYQINGNFYFASIKFLKKNKSFFRNNMTLPIFQKNKKLYLDIDTKSDYLLAKSFLNK